MLDERRCDSHFKDVKRKTDKDDAIKLAHLASINQLKATHVPTKAMRELRRLIKYRKKLVGRVNKCKNMAQRPSETGVTK